MSDISLQERKMQVKKFAEHLMFAFPPGVGAHGRLSGWAKNEDGTKRIGSKQQYTVDRAPDLKDYIYHLIQPQSEPRGIGVYPLSYVTKKVSFIVIDIDEDSTRARQAVLNICELIKMRGGTPYVERTTQNRWHMWYIPSSPIPIKQAEMITKALVHVAKTMRVPVESYPATFPDNPMQPRIGKYINIPYRGALYSYITGKSSDYDMSGKTFLIDPYEMDESEDDDHEENEDGAPVLIFDLNAIKRNDYHTSQRLFDFGSLIFEHEEKEGRRKRRERRKRTGETEPTIVFADVIDKLSARPPHIGDRHACILACAGVACRQGIEEGEVISKIVNCAMTWNKPGERRDWHGEVTRAVESTYSNHSSNNGRITGVPTLIKMGVITL